MAILCLDKQCCLRRKICKKQGNSKRQYINHVMADSVTVLCLVSLYNLCHKQLHNVAAFLSCSWNTRTCLPHGPRRWNAGSTLIGEGGSTSIALTWKAPAVLSFPERVLLASNEHVPSKSEAWLGKKKNLSTGRADCRLYVDQCCASSTDARARVAVPVCYSTESHPGLSNLVWRWSPR